MNLKSLIIILIILVLVSCVKTEDKLITARDECKDKEHLNNPEDARDEYDNCLLFTEEELTSSEGCKKKCQIYCDSRDMLYVDSWTDFSGCRCTCKLNLQSD